MEPVRLVLVGASAALVRQVTGAFAEIDWTAVAGAAEALELLDRIGFDGVVIASDRERDRRQLARAARVPVAVLADLTGDGLPSFCEAIRVGPGYRARVFGERHRLTRREHDVLQLIARDLRRAEIADRLGISYWTVHAHIRHILIKCNLRRTAEIRELLEVGGDATD
jgi:DNA-binding CsgD family transcriptional regulator